MFPFGFVVGGAAADATALFHIPSRHRPGRLSAPSEYTPQATPAATETAQQQHHSSSATPDAPQKN